MTIADLIFVCRSGWVIGVFRDSGQVVWTNDQIKAGSVTLMLDGDRLIVSASGYLYCLDPMAGRIRWQSPMTAYGEGATILASARGGAPAATP